MSDRFTYICTVHLLIIKDDKILLLRRFQTGHEDGNYGVSAGHLDGNETIKEGCAREAKEEIGIDVSLFNLNLVHVLHRKKSNRKINPERIDFFFMTTQYDGEIKNLEPHKCDDLQWFPLDSLPDNTIGYVQQAINSYKDDINYSEYGWV